MTATCTVQLGDGSVKLLLAVKQIDRARETRNEALRTVRAQAEKMLLQTTEDAGQVALAISGWSAAASAETRGGDGLRGA